MFRWDTIRTVLILAASQKLKLSQFDVKIAFLYEILHEEIYMIQLEGFDNGTKQECKPRKSIYDLKQSPRCWNERFKTFANQSELKQSW